MCGVGVVLYGVGVGVWCCVVLVCGVVWCWCVVLYGVGSGAKRGGGVGRRHWDNFILLGAQGPRAQPPMI